MLEGNIIIFKSVLAILKMVKDEILKCNDFEEINDVFEKSTKCLKDTSTLIYNLILRKFKFDDDFITRNRNLILPIIMQNIFESNKNKINKNEQDTIHKRKVSYVDSEMECFSDWPLCIYDNTHKYKIVSHLCFRIFEKPIFVENYFFDLNDKNHNRFSHKCVNEDSIISYDYFDEDLIKFKDLLIERRRHTCYTEENINRFIYVDQDNNHYEQKDIEGSYVEIMNSMRERSKNS